MFTIVFHFPYNDMYLNKFIGYQSELNDNVLKFNTKAEAKDYAQEKTGKYGFGIVELKD